MSCLGSKHELLQVADHVIAHYYHIISVFRLYGIIRRR